LILVDTSIWIDHFRRQDAFLSSLLRDDRVLMHPFVIGELALGNLQQRDVILAKLHRLSRPATATHAEALQLIDRHSLFGTGIDYVDAHLLAAAFLSPGAGLWTRDKRLLAVAQRLNIAASAVH
jgi:predicted nucleic acid-binding protein